MSAARVSFSELVGRYELVLEKYCSMVQEGQCGIPQTVEHSSVELGASALRVIKKTDSSLSISTSSSHSASSVRSNVSVSQLPQQPPLSTSPKRVLKSALKTGGTSSDSSSVSSIQSAQQQAGQKQHDRPSPMVPNSLELQTSSPSQRLVQLLRHSVLGPGPHTGSPLHVVRSRNRSDRVRKGHDQLQASNGVLSLLSLVEELLELFDTLTREYKDHYALPPLSSTSAGVGLKRGSSAPMTPPRGSSASSPRRPLPPLGTKDTASNPVSGRLSVDVNETVDHPAPQRTHTVQFKESGAFVNFEPLSVDDEGGSLKLPDSPGSSSGSMSTPHSMLSHLLQRKSVVMQQQLSRTMDPNGLEMVNDFLILDELGHGASGNVYFVLDTRSSQEYAMKELKRERFAMRVRALHDSATLSVGAQQSPDDAYTASMTAINREVAIMKKLNHPNICRLHEVIDDSTTKTVFLIMDYIPGGHIAKNFDARAGTCTPVPLPKVRHYTQQIVEGLRYLHRRHIVHRDLKIENLLLDDRNDRVVLVDFGVSSEATTEGRISGFKGTPAFCAPELFGSEVESVSGPPVDIWSLGITVFTLLFGHIPFSAINIEQLRESIQHGELRFPESFMEPQWVDLISQMLRKDPKKRITLREIRHHPALDDDSDEESTEHQFGSDVSKSDVFGAISTRRASHCPDPQTLRRVSLSISHPLIVNALESHPLSRTRNSAE